jgi:hypothetical protein
MASYWIVVPRGNEELYDLLSMAFKGRTGFSVIVDRRAAHDAPSGAERRARGDALGPDEIVVAEQAERTDKSGVFDERSAHAQMAPRRPVVRRVPRKPGIPARRPRAAEPIAFSDRQRLLIL